MSVALAIYDPRRLPGRFVLSLAAGALTAWTFGRFGPAVRIVTAWNAICATQLMLAWSTILSSGPAESRRWAESRHLGRTVESVITVLASVVSLFAAIYLLRQSDKLPSRAGRALALTCLAAVLGSWLLTHTTYAVSYARRYFREGAGLDFPGGGRPDLGDFAYFSLTIGMCFQVSDVTISSKAMRRMVTGHALISFAFNTSILALALNLVAGAGS